MTAHYNKFTIEYIEAIKRNLNITMSDEGEAIYLPDSITSENLNTLKADVSDIWSQSESAIELLKNKTDSIVQSGLFGLINDFNKALRVGFLIGDRVVLIDYLFERLLSRMDDKNNYKLQIGVIANNLVPLLPLANEGRVVIIPNPLSWNPDACKIITEVSNKVIITPQLISMLNMLSICISCHLHPYTIAESQELYKSIIGEHMKHTDIIGEDGGKYAYEGLLGALISERLLSEIEIIFPQNISLSKYISIISENQKFYSEYLANISSGGSLAADNNIENVKNAILNSIGESNLNTKKKILKNAATLSGIVGDSIVLVGACITIPPPLTIIAAILGLSGTLGGLINDAPKNESIVISVFKSLCKQ